MKKFRKVLAFIMASVMVMSSGAASASAYESETDTGNFVIKHLETDGLSMHIEGEEGKSIFATEPDDVKDSSLPHTYDLRDYGRVTEASSQKYDDCWAYATIASLESNSLSSGYGKNYFSRAHLTTFTMNPESEGPKTNDVWSFGGNSFYASLALANLEGIASRSTFPDRTDSSAAIPESQRYNHDSGYVIDDAVVLDDTEDIKEYIMENGAVSADYYSQPLKDCRYSSRYKADMIYTPNTASTNHEIAIVGWDDTIPASEFTVNGKTPTVNGGWLIKNSWTGSDKTSYYMYISYAQKIENVTGFTIREDTDLYENYTYAPRAGEAMLQGENYLGIGNVYTAKKDERITDVGFYIYRQSGTSDISVKVSIYKNLPKDGSINAGTPSYTFSEDIDNYGLYTLALPEAVSLSEGERFGVAIEFHSDGVIYTVLEQNNYTLFKGYEGTYTGGENRSFAKVEEYENYHDIYEEYSSSGVGDVFTQVYTACNHEVTKSADGLVNTCSQCGKELTVCETHTEGYIKELKAATYTSDGENAVYCTECGELIKTESVPKLTVPSISIRNNPGTKKAKYGTYLKLYADVENGNDSCYVRWSDSTEDDYIYASIIYMGNTESYTVTAELVDKDGNPIKDADGNPISDTEKVTVNRNIFLIIIEFIKSLLGIDHSVIEN